MRRLIAFLLPLFILISCSVSEFDVKYANAEKSVVFSEDGNEASFSLIFGLSAEDDYSLEVKDCHNLLWSVKTARRDDGEYVGENLVIPYKEEADESFSYRLISSRGKIREGSISLPATEEALWMREGNVLIPLKENISSAISWREGSLIVKKTTDERMTLPDGALDLKICYTYKGVNYTLLF